MPSADLGGATTQVICNFPMKMRIKLPRLPVGQTGFSWVDLVVLVGLFGLGWSVLHFGRGMLVHFDEKNTPPLSMGLWNIPYYAGRTMLRMWIAFGFSLVFTLITGYMAAKYRLARALILPAMDILQSVPVLGFLSATVTGFMALFPGSLFGVCQHFCNFHRAGLEHGVRILPFHDHRADRLAGSRDDVWAQPLATLHHRRGAGGNAQLDLEFHDVFRRRMVFRRRQ
jgi:hypothetical protein